MNLKSIVTVSLALAAIVIVASACKNAASTASAPATAGSQKILYYTCPMHPTVKSDKPGDCPLCGMALQPVYGADATNSSSTTTNADADAKPYPLDVCLVDGMKLGSMGDPYVFVYQGQQIKFCCAGCKPEFLKDPAKYLKKLQDAPATSQN